MGGTRMAITVRVARIPTVPSLSPTLTLTLAPTRMPTVRRLALVCPCAPRTSTLTLPLCPTLTQAVALVALAPTRRSGVSCTCRAGAPPAWPPRPLPLPLPPTPYPSTTHLASNQGSLPHPFPIADS